MVFEKIKEILAEQLDVDPESITMETNIVDDLGADSLDLMELSSELEDEYDVVFADESIGELRTVKEVVEFVESLA